MYYCLLFTRMIAEETEKSLEDTQKRLSMRERELHNQEERGVALEDKCQELKRALEIAKDDISQLRVTINSMDREKDSLQHTVDEKTEKIAHLNEDILLKVTHKQFSSDIYIWHFQISGVNFFFIS